MGFMNKSKQKYGNRWQIPYRECCRCKLFFSARQLLDHDKYWTEIIFIPHSHHWMSEYFTLILLLPTNRAKLFINWRSQNSVTLTQWLMCGYFSGLMASILIIKRRCSGRVISSCSACDTRRVTVRRHEHHLIWKLVGQYINASTTWIKHFLNCERISIINKR